jgi:hypothetical protein
MRIKEIVKEYLKQAGFDGLYLPGECACKIDDLFPCGEITDDCLPGYLSPCDCGEHDWHIDKHKIGESHDRP